MLRVGLGFDVHAFATPSAGRPLVLGGVTIPGQNGLEGHSDADVLVHAVCDAVLGALGLGDLGKHFPDSDPHLKGVSSLTLLDRVASLMEEKGYRLINLDTVVIAQVPRIAPYVEEMRTRLAAGLKATLDEVNVKGTSPEGLGSLGRKDGIAAESIVLLGRI
ncbi:MAG TPA: 2-C-methyl-D-erythritol 2,4-cyclodiphosphate synthase [Patescibacteria group bacterium]|nr:2-C-methyl-D-erythritol 2,4-cyclodiphosphate synthase [Patescibacteria group bacterium]